MRIIVLDLEKPTKSSVPLAACIGYFDGMHLGHQALIRQTRQTAERLHCENALITFDPDPWVTIRGIRNVQHISTLKQRINRAVSFGIENIILLKFTSQMAHLSPQEFADRILSQCNLKALICGFDFRYGCAGAGTPEMLKQLHRFEVTVIPPVVDSTGKISSTRISRCIVSGQIAEANAMLGYPYEMEGTIIHGRQKGTAIGFPTANVRVSSECLMPKAGVYACYAIVDGVRYRAMVNLGHNPTFNYTETLSLEAHLINFDHNIYGRTITLQFIRFLREERRFQSTANLVMQLEQDLQNVKKYLTL